MKEVKPSVLVVDDVLSNLELMEAVFQRDGFIVHTALNSTAALEYYHNHPIDIAILDVMMPGINGFELCKIFKDLSGKRFFPVVLLTALSDTKSRITGIESGADDFISKPFDIPELLTKVKSLLKVKGLHDELEHSENIIFSLVIAMEARDAYTKGHSTRVGEISKDFASFIGFPEKEQEMLRKAGILHDVGKMGMSEAILKKPGKLTDVEIEVIKRHTLIGEDICRPLQSLKSVIPAIRSHHERWDGRGFPDGLAGEDIPLMARILAILDSFDAMVSVRPYRDRKTIGSALAVLEAEQHSGQWDPELAGLFLRMMQTTSSREEILYV